MENAFQLLKLLVELEILMIIRLNLNPLHSLFSAVSDKIAVMNKTMDQPTFLNSKAMQQTFSAALQELSSLEIQMENVAALETLTLINVAQI